MRPRAVTDLDALADRVQQIADALGLWLVPEGTTSTGRALTQIHRLRVGAMAARARVGSLTGRDRIATIRHAAYIEEWHQAARAAYLVTSTQGQS